VSANWQSYISLQCVAVQVACCMVEFNERCRANAAVMCALLILFVTTSMLLDTVAKQNSKQLLDEA
jgi:hypothetical protein